MEQQIREATRTFETQFQSDDDMQFRPLLSEAIKIANISLCSFTGVLLEKGLNIAKSIAEFDAELSIGQLKDGRNAG